MKSKMLNIIYVMFGIFFLAVIINLITQNSLISGNWNTINNAFASLFAELVLLALGLFFLIKRR